MEKTYNFPVFGTQGGGLVREIKTDSGYKYIFVEKPDCPGLDVGDFMPEEWGIIPANKQAQEVIAEEEFGDMDLDTFFAVIDPELALARSMAKNKPEWPKIVSTADLGVDISKRGI